MPRWIVLLLLLAACRPAEPPGTVVFASGADLQSMNPLFTTHPLAKQVQRYAVLMTLVRYDSALGTQPYLAERWMWSADRRRLTFTLRSDVAWDDGTPTTSADVAFTLRAAADSATGYPRRSELACVSAVSAPSAREVALDFCRAQPGVPDVLADLAILPARPFAGLPDAALHGAAWNDAPVGNGPYRVTGHVPNQRWVLEANPRFPRALGGPPRVRRLVIAVVDEPTTKLAGLVSGELDVAGIAPMHASVVRRIAGRRVVDYPLLLTYALAWNTSRPPFADAHLRRALTMAIDRRQIVDAYLYGFGEVADGPVPPAHPLAAAVPRIPFDRAAAEAALDSLGWRRGADGVRARAGRRLDFTLTTVGTSDNVLEQLIQADLAAVGVVVRIRQLELGAFLALAQGGTRDYDALVVGITGDLALGYLDALFDSRRRGEPLQYAQYADPAVDRALDAGDLATVQRLVARDVPLTFLYHARGVQGVSDRLAGVRMDLRGELATLTDWRIAESAR